MNYEWVALLYFILFGCCVQTETLALTQRKELAKVQLELATESDKANRLAQEVLYSSLAPVCGLEQSDGRHSKLLPSKCRLQSRSLQYIRVL